MKRIHLLATLVLLMPLASRAQGTLQAPGWYAGLDVGSVRSDAKINENVLGPTTARSTDSTTGFRVRGGYQFWKWFALELAYVDFGEFKSHFEPDDCPSGSPSPCPLDVRTSMHGLIGTVRFIVPIRQHWFLDARLGWGKMDLSVNQAGGAGLDEDNENPLFQYGIGGGYRFNDHWEIAFDYSEYNQEDFLQSLDGDFGVYNLGESSVSSVGVAYHW